MPDPGTRRAWGWVAHLRDGGTTPWADWRAPADPTGRYLPGAQQLELLRRLNEAGRPTPRLVRRALTVSAPGRGLPELDLAGASDPSPFGLPPVDPATLPPEELVRVAAALLAEDLVAVGLPSPAPPAPARPWRRRYRLVGDPWLADPLRAGLTRLGRPPGGRGAVVLVVGTGVAEMLTHAWAVRCFGAGAPAWDDWLADLAGRRGLPAGVDLAHAARAWAERVGPRRVRVVLEPGLVPGLAGAPRRVRAALPPPRPVPADGAELARRVGPVLGVLAGPERRTELLRRVLLPRVLEAGGPALILPDGHRRWVRRRSARVRDALLAGGYPVAGGPEALLARPGTTGATSPAPSGLAVLGLALRLLHEGERAGDPAAPEDRQHAQHPEQQEEAT